MSGRRSSSLLSSFVAMSLCLLSASAAAAATIADDTAYTQYNNAIAMIQAGRAAEGTSLLDSLSRDTGADPIVAALRDQANISLGYHYLRTHQGAAAIPVFARVRSPGPCASRALLGLGWALMAPPGTRSGNDPWRAMPTSSSTIGSALRPRLTEDIAALRRRMPYRLQAGTPDEQHALQLALVPWMELIGRDPLDAAVQEGMLAIPYAFDHLGAHQEARDYYGRAITLLERSQRQLGDALAQVSEGRLAARVGGEAPAGAKWWLALLPGARWWVDDTLPETFYFERLIEDQDFRDAAELFRSAVQAGADAGPERSRLDAAATAALRRMQLQTGRYLGLAHFALARIYDQPVEAATR